MSKTIFKVLVIDDEATRNKTYEEVLSNKFDIEIINDINNITKKKVMQFDLLVIDICLSKNVESFTAFKILDEYKLTLPTVLVSGEWIKENGEPNEFILRVPNYKNVIKVVSWNEFNKEGSNKRISEEIFYEFCKNRNIAMGNNSDKSVILHLSDLQFGGELAGTACNDNSRIVNFLCENSISPDFIVITGDIADKGKKEEFEAATNWIEQLAKELWNIDGELQYQDRQRIIIVPGNHDYDISVSASDLYKFVFGSNNKDEFEKITLPIEFKHQKLGFSNFINFACNLTGEDKWFRYLDKGIKTNDRFINFGINFFELNSVYKITSRNCENRFDGFYCDLSNYSDAELKCSKKNVDGIINILIMHNPPEDFRKSTPSGERSWNIFQTLVQDNKINLCLYGHTHDFKYAYQLKDNGGDYCKKMVCVPAPTVRLAAASRTEDASRGFNIIEMQKSDGKYNKIYIKNFEIKKASISEVSQDAFEL